MSDFDEGLPPPAKAARTSAALDSVSATLRTRKPVAQEDQLHSPGFKAIVSSMQARLQRIVKFLRSVNLDASALVAHMLEAVRQSGNCTSTKPAVAGAGASDLQPRLVLAVALGDTQEAAAAVGEGALVKFQLGTLLALAAALPQAETLDLLLRTAADEGVRGPHGTLGQVGGVTPLDVALALGHFASAVLLLQRGCLPGAPASTNPPSLPPHLQAALFNPCCGDTCTALLVKTLVMQLSFSPDTGIGGGRTLLHGAVGATLPRTVTALLQLGASVRGTFTTVPTPMHCLLSNATPSASVLSALVHDGGAGLSKSWGAYPPPVVFAAACGHTAAANLLMGIPEVRATARVSGLGAMLREHQDGSPIPWESLRVAVHRRQEEQQAVLLQALPIAALRCKPHSSQGRYCWGGRSSPVLDMLQHAVELAECAPEYPRPFPPSAALAALQGQHLDLWRRSQATHVMAIEPTARDAQGRTALQLLLSAAEHEDSPSDAAAWVHALPEWLQHATVHTCACGDSGKQGQVWSLHGALARLVRKPRAHAHCRAAFAAVLRMFPIVCGLCLGTEDGDSQTAEAALVLSTAEAQVPGVHTTLRFAGIEDPAAVSAAVAGQPGPFSLRRPPTAGWVGRLLHPHGPTLSLTKHASGTVPRVPLDVDGSVAQALCAFPTGFPRHTLRMMVLREATCLTVLERARVPLPPALQRRVILARFRDTEARAGWNCGAVDIVFDALHPLSEARRWAQEQGGEPTPPFIAGGPTDIDIVAAAEATILRRRGMCLESGVAGGQPSVAWSARHLMVASRRRRRAIARACPLPPDAAQ